MDNITHLVDKADTILDFAKILLTINGIFASIIAVSFLGLLFYISQRLVEVNKEKEQNKELLKETKDLLKNATSAIWVVEQIKKDIEEQKNSIRDLAKRVITDYPSQSEARNFLTCNFPPEEISNINEMSSDLSNFAFDKKLKELSVLANLLKDETTITKIKAKYMEVHASFISPIDLLKTLYLVKYENESINNIIKLPSYHVVDPFQLGDMVSPEFITSPGATTWVKISTPVSKEEKK